MVYKTEQRALNDIAVKLGYTGDYMTSQKAINFIAENITLRSFINTYSRDNADATSVTTDWTPATVNSEVVFSKNFSLDGGVLTYEGEAGLYEINMHVYVETTIAGLIEIGVAKNGVIEDHLTIPMELEAVDDTGNGSIAGMIYLEPGDEIDIEARADSSGDITVVNTSRTISNCSSLTPM